MIPFGTVIEKLRKARGLSQKDLALHAGIRQSYLSQIETGKKHGTLRALEGIGKALDCPLPILAWFTLEDADIPWPKRRSWPSIRKAAQIILHEFFPDLL